MDNIRNEVRNFILDEVNAHPKTIVSLVADKFKFTRQRAHAYISREIKAGKIIKVGDNRWTRYFLAGGNYIEFSQKITPNLQEDRVWSTYVKPMLLNYPRNIQDICSYGFTEIFNNAIFHSEGKKIYTIIKINDNKLTITIIDDGIGIFQKIQRALNLENIRESLLHLSKGKFTTDPTNHTGEGIFFTSRVFDRFSILSDDMYYRFQNTEWFLSDEKRENLIKGTLIQMELFLNSAKTPKGIMDQYTDSEIGFGKTIVAVALSADLGDPHVSRSQAKRLLVGLDKFKEIVLDFKGVESVGQAFVDEVFRVFKNEHPDISIHYFNANESVDTMVKRGATGLAE